MRFQTIRTLQISWPCALLNPPLEGGEALPVDVRYHQIQCSHYRHQVPDLSSPGHMIKCAQVAEARRSEFDPVWRRATLADDVHTELASCRLHSRIEFPFWQFQYGLCLCLELTFGNIIY